MNCQNCGQPLPTDASFCSNCGTSIKSVEIQVFQTQNVGHEAVELIVAVSAENTQPLGFENPPPASFPYTENNPQVYSQTPFQEGQFVYTEQPLQQAGFVTQPQQPAPKKNSMVLLVAIVAVLSVLLIGALSVFFVGSLSGGWSSQKMDKETNVLLVKDARGRYYTVHSDGTSEALDIPKDSIYFLNNISDRWFSTSSMGSSSDNSKKLFFSSDYSKYFASNDARDIKSDLILLDKKTVEILEGATYCYGSSDLNTLYYVSESGGRFALYVYSAKTGESIELDRSRNVQNLSQYTSACSSDGKIFMYVLGNPDSNKDTTTYKIVNGGEPVEIGKNIYPISFSDNQKNFMYYELDSKGNAKLIHETGGETITIASRINVDGIQPLITNQDTTELIYQNNGKSYYYTTNQKPVHIFDGADFILFDDTYSPIVSQASFSNDSLKELVFIDSYEEVFYYFDKEGNMESDNYNGRILFSNDVLYYTNSSNTLYKLSMKTGENERISRNVFFFNVSNLSDTVVYSTDDEDVHAIVNGKETVWKDYTVQWCDVSDDGKYIYFIDYEEGEAYLSIGGAEPFVIDEANIFFVSVIGDNLYYIDGDDSLFVYNPKTNGVIEIMNRVDTIIPTYPVDLFKSIYQ